MYRAAITPLVSTTGITNIIPNLLDMLVPRHPLLANQVLTPAMPAVGSDKTTGTSSSSSSIGGPPAARVCGQRVAAARDATAVTAKLDHRQQWTVPGRKGCAMASSCLHASHDPPMKHPSATQQRVLQAGKKNFVLQVS
mmetsp:Transcript_107509/g.213504  ORF Transcript_107509/g.213504 Transcript_107509/m.213504 type:complete len:139 (+) Transcript_107509:110-526(+)